MPPHSLFTLMVFGAKHTVTAVDIKYFKNLDDVEITLEVGGIVFASELRHSVVNW